MLRNIFGENVKMMRLKRGWAQDVLAELSSLHRNYIGNIERYEVNAGIDNIDKIAKAFEVEPSDLLRKMDGIL